MRLRLRPRPGTSSPRRTVFYVILATFSAAYLYHVRNQLFARPRTSQKRELSDSSAGTSGRSQPGFAHDSDESVGVLLDGTLDRSLVELPSELRSLLLSNGSGGDPAKSSTVDGRAFGAYSSDASEEPQHPITQHTESPDIVPWTEQVSESPDSEQWTEQVSESPDSETWTEAGGQRAEPQREATLDAGSKVMALYIVIAYGVSI